MENPVLTNNTLRVKESNSNLILDTLKKFGTATRTEIAKDTGLSIATCGNILKDLVGTGEILEGDLENCNGGRPARRYIYNKNYSLIIALTLHADSSIKTLQYAVANLYGEIIEERVKAYDAIDFDTIDNLIKELIADHPSIKAVGIGIPGIVDKDGTVSINDIDELNGIKLAKHLSENRNINVAIDRSPAISAYGFYNNHPEYTGKAIATMLAPLEHPLGAGFIIDGQIYKGNMNMEGEISYVFNGFSNENLPSEGEDSTLIQQTVFAIAATVSTINPSAIVFMGKSFSDEIFEKICAHCDTFFPENFIPEFVHLQDYSSEYLSGTIQIAIDCLRPKIKLIAR